MLPAPLYCFERNSVTIFMIMSINFVKIFFLFLVVVFGSSCLNTQRATYFNNAQEANVTPSSQDAVLPLIQKNDILNVTISSLNAEASAIFNLPVSSNSNMPTNTSVAGGQSGVGYLVNAEGNIQMPVLGNIKVAGLTSQAIKDNITAMILERKLLIDPIVFVHQLNYEVTVLGEVGRPTVINVPNEKISLLKALGIAGDITIYGKKDNVLLIREINGKRQVKRVNLNEASFLTSSFYYLQPNDVVYVEPTKDRVASVSAFKQNLPTLLSALSVVLISLQLLKK